MAVHSGVASVPPAADSLLCLPNEILLIIKTLIPPWDIRTHVCYFYTCQRIAGLYGNADKQEDFWASACHLAGIGMLPGEHKQTVSWTDIALVCIEDDGFCGHPRCGGALLEHNGMHASLSFHTRGMNLYFSSCGNGCRGRALP
jgi:hypothetical protein